MQIDAILFDNDGVLVDTEGLYYEANREIFSERGLSLDHATFAAYSLGLGKSMLDLLGELAPGELESLRVRRNAIYADKIRRDVRIFDGVEGCLGELHGLQPMAIVTSARADDFEIIHEQTGLLRFFEFAIKGGDYKQHKPHPEPYLLAAERLGVQPERCLVVEDTERGLAAATAAGMRCIVVPNRLAVDAEFASAHRIVATIKELPALVVELRRGR